MELNVKEVAIYLRKSRDETDGKEDVLGKHRRLLIEYANKHNLKYQIYEEIGNSEYIDTRPEMVRLLKDIEQDLYDAVLVVDMDRLGRGELEEAGRIKRIFRDSNTLVLTPTRVYNFNNDDEQIMTDIEMVFANYEYRMIKKRMLRGKKQGAKAGKWTNGRPPYPYVYNRLTKELDVDTEKLKVYNLMKKMFIDDMIAPYEIAWELNKLGFKTNTNSDWHESSVQRILTSEVHLGKVIYGKTTVKGKKASEKVHSKKDPSEWIVAEGSHQSLKTQEEHEQILAIISSRRLKPLGSRHNTQVLSKLLYCGKCGKTMSFINKQNGKCYIKTCTKADHLGHKCGNQGMSAEVIYAQLFFDLQHYEEQLLTNNKVNEKTDSSTLKLALKNKQDELERLEAGEERLFDLYVEGMLDKNQLRVKQEKLNKQIQVKKEEIRSIEKSLAVVEGSRTDEDRINAIQRFKKAWDSADISKKELNTLAKEIIDRIELIREDKNIEIKINFL